MTTSRDGTIAMFSIYISVARVVVTEMKKVALKKKGSLAVRLFRRLLRASSGFQESVSLQDRDTHVDIPRNTYSNYQEKIKIALEVERIKAEAIMERKRCLFIC